MATIVSFLAFAGALAVVLGAVAWLGLRVRRRGVGGDFVGPVEEIFRPTAPLYRAESRAQEERMAPMPSPDDRLRAQ